MSYQGNFEVTGLLKKENQNININYWTLPSHGFWADISEEQRLFVKKIEFEGDFKPKLKIKQEKIESKKKGNKPKLISNKQQKKTGDQKGKY